MRNRLSVLTIAIAAALVVMGATPPSHAVTVTYSTVGTFTGGEDPGNNTYTNGGLTIVFNGVPFQDVNDFPSGISFGTFDTSGSAADTPLTALDGTFELQIFQTSPTTGESPVLVGTLQGSLASAGGEAWVQFNEGDLTQTIGEVTYQITEADAGTPGRVNLVPPTIGSPAGVSSIEGTVNATVTPIPEPSTLLMGALAVPALLAFRLRKKS